MAVPGDSQSRQQTDRLLELAGLFLRLGLTAFGGPAAHIAMMRSEVVERRQWLSEAQFLDLLGVTNLIPGPNSTEMAIHIGRERAGLLGLLVAGVCFILPAALLVAVLAWAYVAFGTTPEAAGLLYGIKPVVIAVVLEALWKLGRRAISGPVLLAVALAVFGLYLAGINELVLLFGGGIAVLLLRSAPGSRLGGWVPLPLLAALPAAVVPVSLGTLFLTFLKIGAVLYGSGYVLLAFLRADFVEHLGWLSEQQLIDAVAVGQVTPGPVFTTATFVGFVVGGWLGAAVATLGIFLPSFIYVALAGPLVERLRQRPATAALLDGVNASALALMAGVLFELGRAALVDGFSVGLAIVAAVLLVRLRVNSAWLLVLGGLAGIAWQLWRP